MNNLNISPINNHFQQQNIVITMQDILPKMQRNYEIIGLVFASYLMFYVLFNVFVAESEKKTAWRKELDQMAIIPIVWILIIYITQITGFKGI